MVNWTGKRGPSEKPFRDALRMELAAAAAGNGSHKELRRLARALIERAATGDVSALRETADRLDGTVPQAIVGDSEYDPVNIRGIAWLDGLDGLDSPNAPANAPAIEHQANEPLQLTAQEVIAPIVSTFSFRVKRQRGPDYNERMREYMQRKRAAAKLLDGKG
jgi:hypothetical protein